MTSARSFSSIRPARLALAGFLWFLVSPMAGAVSPDVAESLNSGKLARAEELLTDHLSSQGDDDLARFQLGTVQFLRAAERLSQDGARYGVLSRELPVPFLRMAAIATDREPEPVRYEDVRTMIERFQQGVARAEATLQPIRDPDLSWPLSLQKVRLDLDGDGEATERETLHSLFLLAASGWGPPQGIGEGPPVRFDSADVYWLRGYCHVLMALADMILAYDHQRLFELTAHVIFAQPQTEFAAMHDRPSADANPDSWEGIRDLIAAVHLVNLPLHEPQRLRDAQQHLLQMVDLSRQSWKLILAENDDEGEWIPGPNQRSVIPSMMMDRPRIAAWQQFLDEAESILQGENLIPFWRSGFDRGVNLGKAFGEPRDFDLVLWVQGTAAMPYLEEGEKSSPETWQEFQRVFRGQFIGFAIWIN